MTKQQNSVLVVVTLDPPIDFMDKIMKACVFTERVVIVDNGCALDQHILGASLAKDCNQVDLIQFSSNLGLAHALNVGALHAMALGAETILFLDDDSSIDEDSFQRLQQTLLRTDIAQQPGAVVPSVTYRHAANRCRWPKSVAPSLPFFRMVYADSEVEPLSVDLAIGSGMLVRASVWKEIGGFDSGLFVDLVDTDYCLRARTQGHPVVAVPAAKIQHSLGNPQQKRLLGVADVFPTHHAPVRHYYISRNRIHLLKRHGLRFPSWVVYESLSAIKLFAKVVLYEHHRREKLRATLIGTWHGLLGRTGPAPHDFSSRR